MGRAVELNCQTFYAERDAEKVSGVDDPSKPTATTVPKQNLERPSDK